MPPVHIACRLRPSTGPHIVVADMEKNTIISCERAEEYKFKAVFGPDASDEDVYKKCMKPILDDNSTSCTVAFYGQTGSGKTKTFCGGGGDGGMLSFFLNSVFENPSSSPPLTVNASDIYNAKTQQLLLGQLVSSADEARAVVSRLMKQRRTAPTLANATSSRSHLICSFSGPTRVVTFIDLAGSERLLETGTDPARRQEAININKSLTALRDVIENLSHHKTHIPFRNSPLTVALKEYLTKPDSVFLLVLCGSPSERATIDTLRFGRTATRINRSPDVMNRARRVINDMNEAADKLPVVEERIVQLEKELEQCRAELQEEKNNKRKNRCGVCGERGHNKRRCANNANRTEAGGDV